MNFQHTFSSGAINVHSLHFQRASGSFLFYFTDYTQLLTTRGRLILISFSPISFVHDRDAGGITNSTLTVFFHGEEMRISNPKCHLGRNMPRHEHTNQSINWYLERTENSNSRTIHSGDVTCAPGRERIVWIGFHSRY